MAKRLHQFKLDRAANGPQPVTMPRRARIMGAEVHARQIVLYAEVEEDANTKAFDVKHVRGFQICHVGDVIPEGAPLVAYVNGHHVYEVKP